MVLRGRTYVDTIRIGYRASAVYPQDELVYPKAAQKIESKGEGVRVDWFVCGNLIRGRVGQCEIELRYGV